MPQAHSPPTIAAMSMFTRVALACTLALGLMACESDENPFSNLICRSSSDCAQGLTCSNGTCVDGRGTRDTGTPSLDVGGGGDAGTCTPDCAGRTCGSDGCGGVCGSCTAAQFCNASGVCQAGSCTPSCAGRQCGDDGCGGSCGSCAGGMNCIAGICEAGGSGLDCQGVIGCLNTNECADESCFNMCLDQGTPAAQQQIVALLQCIDANCTGLSGDAFQQCQQTQCAAELSACSGGGGSGTANCPTTVQCLVGCSSSATTDDEFQQCGANCQSNAAAGAATQAVDAYNCVITAVQGGTCPQLTTAESFYTCLDSACPAEASACGI